MSKYAVTAGRSLNLLTKEDAIKRAVEDLKDGKIIGLKGVSGYQLVCLPTQESALELRRVKGRENKPFAVMFSSVEAALESAQINDLEKELLESSERPIVLLKKKKDFPALAGSHQHHQYHICAHIDGTGGCLCINC